MEEIKLSLFADVIYTETKDDHFKTIKNNKRIQKAGETENKTMQILIVHIHNIKFKL